MKRIVLIYGSILGLLLSINLVYMVYQCYTNPDFQPNMVLGFAVILVMLSLVPFGIKSYRNNQLNGTISLGKAFSTGALIALVGSTIYVIVWLVAYYVYVPDFMDKYSVHELRNAIKNGASLQDIARIKKESDNYKELYKSPFWVVVLTYIEVLPLGLAVAFVSSIALRRKAINK
jgi:hypothetical protein